jgi:hypothetical protein
VKFDALVTLPPFVVTMIFPVLAPVGTVAVTSVSETTVKVADFPLKVTFVVWSSPVPVIVTSAPTAPLVGENVFIVGVTRKLCELVSTVDPVVTVTDPVSAAAGTVAVKYVLPVRVTVTACVPPNFTVVVLPKPCPRIPIFAPSAPEVDNRLAYAFSPLLKL